MGKAENKDKTIQVVDSAGAIHIFRGTDINFFTEGVLVRVYSTSRNTLASFCNYVSCKFV